VNCVQEKGRIRVPRGFVPRDWARAAYALYLRHEHKDFAVNACPGAGKTRFAVMLAYNELYRGAYDRLDLVGPSVHICEQWAREFATWGLNLDPENVSESKDCIGRVMTYQRLGMDAESFRLKDRRRTLVILDEIHHAGDSKSWGDGLRHAFHLAKSRLLLSGTPFRSDNNAIPFVRYSQGSHGASISDFTYGYGDALRDNYCAPLYFPYHDGEFHWERDGKSYNAGFFTQLRKGEKADRLRTALEPNGSYVRGMLAEAHEHLMEIRKTHPEAGGLVFGRDVKNCEQLAEVLQRLTGRPVMTVTNDDADATQRIRRFRAGTDPWLVSVKMVSEGVDIPRLRVGVFLSNVRTEMFFRQAAGRLVRLVPGLEDQSGYLYIPSDPKLVEHAQDMQRERKHYLGEQVEEGPLDGEPEEPREREQKEELYRFLDSRGERVGVIDTGPPAEGNGQVLFEFAQELAVEPTVPPPPPPKEEPRTIHEVKTEVRRKGGRLSSLVQEIVDRHGVPYRKIHSELNRRQGVRSQQQCTLEQLQQRERLLESWARTGKLT